MRDRKVTHGFVSFTEVEAGHHQSYNQWHLFDHMPEQIPLRGVVFGQRWVLTPARRRFMRATTPLDRSHYVTMYLMAEPIDQTLRDFRDLAVELRQQQRFHEHRTSHLAGALALETAAAAPHALVADDALPYRPHRGVYVWLSDVAPPLDDVLAIDGVAGTWTFRGSAASPRELEERTLTIAWLDGDLDAANAALSALAEPAPMFAAMLEPVDPWGRWDWFD